MSKKIKCGGYILKDGVLIQHPTRRFRMPPEMPERMKEAYPAFNDDAVVFFGFGEYESVCDRIDEMNALKEETWKRSFFNRYEQLRNIDELGKLGQILPRFIRPIVRRKRNTLLAKFIKENCRDA